MGGHKAPPAPDYGAATTAGVMADINTLPQRRKIEREAALGLGQFTGLGDIEFGKAQRADAIAGANEMAPALLALQQQYGNAFANQARSELQASDPEAFSLRQSLGSELLAGSPFESSADGPSFGALPTAAAQTRVSSLPTLTSGNTTDGGGATDTLRNALETQLNTDLALGGALSAAERAEVEQAVLRRQAATGNITGNAATFEAALEAAGLSAERKKQRQDAAHGWLNSGQSTFDTANKLRQDANTLVQQGFANTHQNANQNNAAAQQDFANLFQTQSANNANAQQTFANAQQALGQRNLIKQQHVANRNGFVFGQPLNAQFGNLSGAQNGAAPFLPMTAHGAGLNPNAGALGGQFASNVYGTQMQGYGTQASPWAVGAGLLGKLGGAWLLGGV